MNLPPTSARRLAIGIALASFLSVRSGRADEKADCLAAASKGQTLRDAHSLIEAREQFQICARRTCPALVQTDCGSWLETVEKTLPSVVLSAKDGQGRDLIDVSVTADGKPIAQKLDGQAVWMDPGVHWFRFELADGTSATSQVVVKEGEKAQGVAVVLAQVGGTPAGAAGGTDEPAKPAPPDSATDTRPFFSRRGGTQRLTGLVLAGLGVVAFGVGEGIALDAKSKDASARGTASAESDTKSAVKEGNVGTAFCVAAGVVAAAGVVVWFTAPSAKLGVGTNGREVWVGGAF
jgi:hypothetical protein